MKDKEKQVFDEYGNYDFPTEIKQERLNNATSQSEKIIYGSLITSTKCYNCIHFPLCFAQKGGANLGLTGENDCCYYQSKLPEDSVVLSKEEYDTLNTNLCKYRRENKELRVVTDIANERTYRKKFTDEWRKEYQKELDKQGNGHIAGHPDFDLVYKLYFEQKDRIAELEKDKEKWQRKAVNYYQMAKSYGIECIIDNDIDETLKEYEK